MRKVDLIILHCSAASTIGQRIAHIRKWHMDPPPQGNGWKDVGYHYFIGFDGLLEKGRDIDIAGAHCEGHNANSIGICLAGLKMTDFQVKQFDSLKMLLILLKKIYPSAILKGHCELDTKGKTCPVFDTTPLKDFWSKLS